jgi:membrane fusion protein (multidrug efflux system)
VVPESALLQQGRDHFVLRLTGEGEALTAERIQVEIGTRKPGLVEIRSGLAAGDRVITQGQDKVRPGQTIEVLAVDDGTRGLEEMARRRP